MFLALKAICSISTVHYFISIWLNTKLPTLYLNPFQTKCSDVHPNLYLISNQSLQNRNLISPISVFLKSCSDHKSSHCVSFPWSTKSNHFCFIWGKIRIFCWGNWSNLTFAFPNQKWAGWHAIIFGTLFRYWTTTMIISGDEYVVFQLGFSLIKIMQSIYIYFFNKNHLHDNDLHGIYMEELLSLFVWIWIYIIHAILGHHSGDIIALHTHLLLVSFLPFL